jgi:hypothetical protein
MEDFLVLVQLFSYGIGILAMVIGSIWFYVEAFKESVGWFFACLIIPIASLVFLFMHPERVLKPMGVIFLGLFFVVMANFM